MTDTSPASDEVPKPSLPPLPRQEKEKKEKKAEEEQWFAMRATYRSEKKMKDDLELIGLKCFYPTVMAEKRVGGRRKKVWVPAVASLIFVHGLKSVIQQFKATTNRLQYVCKPDGMGGRTPIIVPDAQMEAFIRLYESNNYEITEDPDIINSIKPGQRVRVLEGPFEGLTGTFQRIKGHRKKTFIIVIESLLCISTTEIAPQSLELVEEEEA